MLLRAVILCGGSGTRLWPLSRGAYPKQFMDLGGETLFGRTLQRAAGLENTGRVLVVCNEEHRFFAAGIAQTQNIPADILLEPEGRNTAPAIAFAAFAALDQAKNDDPALLVMPSDHTITPPEAFYASVKKACAALENDKNCLMTFGIKPAAPETGSGYLVKGKTLPGDVFRVDHFLEKPDSEKAEELIAAGACWNSGIFLFRAQSYLTALRTLAPDIAQACENAWQEHRRDADFIRPGKQAFLSSPADSVDYAVMEHANNVCMVELSAAWSDLGSWEAFYDAAQHDSAGNAVRGDVILQNTANCYLHSTHRLLAVLGVQNLAVIETADAILVADRSQTQEVKTLIERLKAADRSEADTHVRVFRPWGTYELVALSTRYHVKIITVRPGAALSLQLHYHRAEHWVIVSGTAKVTVDQNVQLLTENQAAYIPPGVKHRLENPGRIPLELIEVQSGSYLGEDDIVRFEDIYGRLEKQ